MITAIELDGFKTFHNFNLELAPLQIIVGGNGVGKSNLFDALRLLARLADNQLRGAFQDMRGEAGEIFSTMPDGQPIKHIRLAVELLVERQVKDDWGTTASLKYPRLRYELKIVRRADERGLERLHVSHESLIPIPRDKDSWLKRYSLPDNWLPKVTGERIVFISTDPENNNISLYQDGRKGRRIGWAANKIERTVLSGVTNTEFPHAFAVREEMRRWYFWHLNPENLRLPSSMLASSTIAANGKNLPATLARLKAEDKFLLNDISRDLANLVPDISQIDVQTAQDQYLIQAEAQNGCTFTSRVLSDGTLRALALVTLRNDPQHQGVLCFEEPENGIHPFRLKNLVNILQALATDFSDPEQHNEPLRQLLINTHSPVLINQLDIESNLLFAHLVTQVDTTHHPLPLRATKVVPVKTTDLQRNLPLGISEAEARYTLSQVVNYLNNADMGPSVKALKELSQP